MNRMHYLWAAEQMDWQQVVLNGGPPCFDLDPDTGLFCGRAKRWGGHDEVHKFVPLSGLLKKFAYEIKEKGTK